MKRPEILPLALLAALALFVGTQLHGSDSVPTLAAAAAVPPVSLPLPEAETEPGEAPAPRAPAPVVRSGAVAAAADREDVRRRIRIGESGTYIGEILLGRDSALARWPERLTRPLRVWVQSATDLPDWRPSNVETVHDAFTEWGTVGIPIRFTFMRDSAAADVRVLWIDRFEEPISGRTRWARDDGWWILDGHITLALHHVSGEVLDSSAVRAIALHEVGHLLGLDHTEDTTNIMTPRVRVRSLSAADRATARLLYTLPAGSVR